MHRAELPALCKVWVTYGTAHGPLLRKYATDYLEIVLQFLGKYPKNPIIAIPSKIRGFIYVGNFHLMHIFALLFICSICGLVYNPQPLWLRVLALLSFLLTVYFAYGFAKWCFYMEPKNKFFTWVKMKYLSNLSFIKGGLKNSKKYKTFCIEPSF